MTDQTSGKTPAIRPGAKAILWGGAFSGTWDLVFAFIYYGLKTSTSTPMHVMQSVAGGLLGRATFQGGAPTAVLGVVLHYLIAHIWASIYWGLSRRLPVLVRHAVPAGLVYGAVVYFLMNMVVLPLSAYHTKAYPPALPFWPISMHMLGVGLPIALAVRRFSR